MIFNQVSHMLHKYQILIQNQKVIRMLPINISLSINASIVGKSS